MSMRPLERRHSMATRRLGRTGGILLDFEDCVEVFAGETFDYPDDRRDYGEPRMITVGILRNSDGGCRVDAA
jgi:hypothetical protein